MPLYPDEPLTDFRRLPELMTYCSEGLPPQEHMTLQPVQDGLAAINGARGVHHMAEFNAYGLLMSKWEVSHPVVFNGHDAQAVNFEDLALRTVRFFRCAIQFFNKLSFGGPLYFRLKLNNTRGLRALFGKQSATVLEDYLRMDENYNIAQIAAALPDILQNTLQTAAWSLGLRISDADMRALVNQFLGEK